MDLRETADFYFLSYEQHLSQYTQYELELITAAPV